VWRPSASAFGQQHTVKQKLPYQILHFNIKQYGYWNARGWQTDRRCDVTHAWLANPDAQSLYSSWIGKSSGNWNIDSGLLVRGSVTSDWLLCVQTKWLKFQRENTAVLYLETVCVGSCSCYPYLQFLSVGTAPSVGPFPACSYSSFL
jgi:hypothetical protein